MKDLIPKERYTEIITLVDMNAPLESKVPNSSMSLASAVLHSGSEPANKDKA